MSKFSVRDVEEESFVPIDAATRPPPVLARASSNLADLNVLDFPADPAALGGALFFTFFFFFFFFFFFLLSPCV
jgi:hypothetical protein